MTAWPGSMMRPPRTRDFPELYFRILEVMAPKREYVAEDIRNRLRDAGHNASEGEIRNAMDALRRRGRVSAEKCRFERTRITIYRKI